MSHDAGTFSYGIEVFFQSILIWGFQLVLSVGRGLLISIALMFSAGICKNGLQSCRPSMPASTPAGGHDGRHSLRGPVVHLTSFVFASSLPAASSGSRTLSQPLLWETWGRGRLRPSARTSRAPVPTLQVNTRRVF